VDKQQQWINSNSKQNSADQPGITKEELPSSGNHGPAELIVVDEEMHQQ
jgi:hypothetical protein